MGEDVLIGRGDTCHVQLDGQLVSREHARLVVRPDVVEYYDLGSRNGSFVNGKKVVRPLKLINGDRIKIAFFDLTFESLPVTRSAPATLELIYCTRCHAVLTSEMRFCVSCGDAVDKGLSRTCCPVCSAMITPYMHFCTQCGRKLGHPAVG